MKNVTVLSSKSVKRFVTSTFVIIGMLAVLSFGLVAYVLHLGGVKVEGKPVDIIVLCVSVFLPVVVSIIFLCFLGYYCKKLCEAANIKDEEDFSNVAQMIMKRGVCSFVTTPIVYNAIREEESIQEQLKGMRDLLSKIDSRVDEICPKNKILLVGDGSIDNMCLQEALRFHGIRVDKIEATNAALGSLEKDTHYIAIVFVNKTNDDGVEEKCFLNKIRKMLCCSDEENFLGKIKKKFPNVPVFRVA